MVAAMAETFAGKRVLVTGASSGIGAAVCEALAREGAHLVLAARRVERLEEQAAKCRGLGAQAHVVPADVTQVDACQRMVQESVRALGGLDMVVVNAGLSMWAKFEEITDLSMFRTLMETNYLSAVYTTHFALPHLLASKGRIVAVSSLTGKTGVPTRTAYAASKHAMNGFFDSLRAELSHTGLTITVVCPGFVKTEARIHALAGDGGPLKENPLGQEEDSMSAEECARQTLAAARARKRELIMTPLPRLALIAKVLVPGLIDRIARKRVLLDPFQGPKL
jgi:NAD(P)-dependent dehydrogenase (short-subunit alcohol dehydrogenase family)